MWRIAIVFCSALLFASAESSGIDMMQPIRRQRNVSAIACIVELCESYYVSNKQNIGALLMVHIQNVTPFHDTLMKSLMERNHYAISLINQFSPCDKCYRNDSDNPSEKAKNYFLAFRELDEVTAALRVWSSLPTWDPLARFVVTFMNKYDELKLYSQIRIILEEFFRAHVLNVKVISFRNDSDIIQTHTWYPYEGTNCALEVRNIHLVDECYYSDQRPGQQIVRHIEQLQRLIPIDLHGCPFRVASSLFEPFVYNKSTQRKGIEVHLVQSITHALNMTRHFIYVNETRVNRVVSNQSGIYSLLLKRYDV